jgi:APA family basic amino acid/polyamine antiporter
MTELGIANWQRFFIWMAIGLIIYFGFGMKNSKLAALKAPELAQAIAD